jgi:membrane protease YdiL (CAAX protease family)
MVCVSCPESPWMEAEHIEIKTLVISLATMLCIEVATRAVISRDLSNQMIILGVTRLLEIVLLMLIVLKWGAGLSSIGLAPFKVVSGLKKGLIWSAGFGMVAFFAFLVLFAVGINGVTLIQAQLPGKPSEIILFFVIGGVVGPIAEEIFFRGILYGFFRRWGMVVALVLSTVVFVLAHPSNQGVPVTQAVGGVVFAVAYEVEGNLMAPITIHVLGNVAIFTLPLIL